MHFDEIPIAPEQLEWRVPPEPSLLDDDKLDRLDEVIEQLRELLSVRLTARQRQIVHLFKSCGA